VARLNSSIEIGDLVFVKEGNIDGVYSVVIKARKNYFEKSIIGLKVGEKILYYREDETREPTKSEIKKYIIKNLFTN
jgi:hypothetical protein